ncbi:hypothetical protein STEG23_027685 [Scotinomys teguina]
MGFATALGAASVRSVRRRRRRRQEPQRDSATCSSAATLSLQSEAPASYREKHNTDSSFCSGRIVSRATRRQEQREVGSTGKRNVSDESAEPELQNTRGGARWTPSPGAARMREAPPPLFQPSCQHSGSRTFVRTPSNSGMYSIEIVSLGPAKRLSAVKTI